MNLLSQTMPDGDFVHSQWKQSIFLKAINVQSLQSINYTASVSISFASLPGMAKHSI